MKTENYPHEYLLRLPNELAERFADFRFTNRIGSAAAAMRQIVQLGLEAAERQAGKARVA
jgi:hypothetical protein